MEAYEDVEAVGRGAFATVRRVRRRADGASLVVKKFHHPMSELTPKERAEVAQEVPLAARRALCVCVCVCLCVSVCVRVRGRVCM